jgi:hypothetical protein
MGLMLDAARHVAARGSREPSPFERLRHVLADCRDLIERSGDKNLDLKKFDAWVASQDWRANEAEYLHYERASMLTREQHLVWLASAFAHNDVIAEYMGIDENALTKRQGRLREDGLFEAGAEELLVVVVIALRMAGLGSAVDEAWSKFDHVDPRDREVLAAPSIFALMHPLFADA